MRDVPPIRSGRLLLPLLLLGTFLIYLPTLGGDFVFDDHRFIPENPALGDLSNVAAFFTDPATMTATSGESGWDDIYRPLRTVSFAVSLRLFGLSPFAFRLENLLWHLLAVVAAYFLARRLLGHAGGALAAAGVFALHPLQVESAAWISSRGDLMAAVFMLGSALVLFRENLSLRAILLGLFLFVLALFSKESAIAFVAVLPMHDYCFRSRIGPRRIAIYAALLVLGLLFLALRFSLTTGQLPFTSDTIASTGAAIGVLGAEALLPVRILPYTGDILTPELIGSLSGLLVFIGCVLATVTALVRGRKHPELAFGFLFAALCLLPVSGIVPIKAPASARYAYLPLFGIGLILGGVLRGRGRPVQALCVVLLAALGALTLGEGATWKTDRGLWERSVARARASLGRAGEVALSNLAIIMAQSGDLSGAREAFEESLEVRERGGTWAHLAMVRLQLGDPEGALRATRQAVASDPGSAPVHFRCGMVHGALGRQDEELAAYQRAVELAPGFAMAHARLGMAHGARGEWSRAAKHLRIAAEGMPGSARIHIDLARTLHAAGRTAEALETLEHAASLEPGNSDARANLAMALVTMGRARSALPILQEAIAADPDSFILRFSLARTQAALSRIGEARRSALQARKLAQSREHAAWVEAFLSELR